MSLILPRRRVHIRCSREKCKRRFTLPKHPDEYVRGWKCAGCGGTQFREIKNRAKESGATECQCGAFVWTGSTGRYECTKHRRGTVGCFFRRNGEERKPGDADYLDPNYEPEAADAT